MIDAKELTSKILEGIGRGTFLSAPVIRALSFILEKPFYRVWKKVTLGGESIGNMLASLEKYNLIKTWGNDGKIQYALDAFSSIQPFSQAKQVDIVLLQPKDLNFMEAVFIDVLCRRALDFDLVRCPLESVLHLRQLYSDQPKGVGNDVEIITEPIAGRYAVEISSLNKGLESVGMRTAS